MNLTSGKYFTIGKYQKSIHYLNRTRKRGDKEEATGGRIGTVKNNIK